MITARKTCHPGAARGRSARIRESDGGIRELRPGARVRCSCRCHLDRREACAVVVRTNAIGVPLRSAEYCEVACGGVDCRDLRVVGVVVARLLRVGKLAVANPDCKLVAVVVRDFEGQHL